MEFEDWVGFHLEEEQMQNVRYAKNTAFVGHDGELTSYVQGTLKSFS